MWVHGLFEELREYHGKRFKILKCRVLRGRTLQGSLQRVRRDCRCNTLRYFSEPFSCFTCVIFGGIEYVKGVMLFF